MSRLAALAASLVALAALAPAPAALARDAPGPSTDVTQDAPEPRADLADISDEVMCLTCEVPLELAQEAPQAEAERDFIRGLIAAGRSKDEIKDALVAEYGENVLAVPGTDGFGLAAWLVPIAAFLTAACAIGITLRRWRAQNGSAEPPGGPAGPRTGAARDAKAEQRLDEDMARYDP